jgi:hypothetical protein
MTYMPKIILKILAGYQSQALTEFKHTQCSFLLKGLQASLYLLDKV